MTRTFFTEIACTGRACETGRKLACRLMLAFTLIVGADLVPLDLRSGHPEQRRRVSVPLFAFQPERQEPTPVQHETGVAQADEHATEEEHGGGLLDVVARLVNFALLAGTLVYFLRSPIRTYLLDRGTQIRSDLVNAREMKETAAAQIAEIDRKMKALPGELEALRIQGAQEIAAEEERIRKASAAERDRLLEQARREIDLQVKVAERELVSHAADLAVGVASQRIKKSITDEDQKRLVDRYVQQLRS